MCAILWQRTYIETLWKKILTDWETWCCFATPRKASNRIDIIAVTLILKQTVIFSTLVEEDTLFTRWRRWLPLWNAIYWNTKGRRSTIQWVSFVAIKLDLGIHTKWSISFSSSIPQSYIGTWWKSFKKSKLKNTRQSTKRKLSGTALILNTKIFIHPTEKRPDFGAHRYLTLSEVCNNFRNYCPWLEIKWP